MTRHIPWLRVMVEGAVIVVSVLLALAADAWWDARQDRAEEQELLAAIQSDLISSQALLRESIARVETAQAQLQDFAQAPPEALGAHPDSVDAAVLSGLTRPWTTELALGSLDATISAGKLSLIRDASIRAALVNVMKLDADLEEPRSYMSQITVDAIHAINLHPDLAEQYSVTRVRMLARSSLERMKADREIMAFVTDKIVANNSYLIQSQRVLEHLENTTALIRAGVGADD